VVLPGFTALQLTDITTTVGDVPAVDGQQLPPPGRGPATGLDPGGDLQDLAAGLRPTATDGAAT
jgi:hypothetical protein